MPSGQSRAGAAWSPGTSQAAAPGDPQETPGTPRRVRTRFYTGETEARVGTEGPGWSWSCSRRGVSSAGITCPVIHGCGAAPHSFQRGFIGRGRSHPHGPVVTPVTRG